MVKNYKNKLTKKQSKED